jgi:DNA-directed RNA polymerase specialized sigma24 family protein
MEARDSEVSVAARPPEEWGDLLMFSKPTVEYNEEAYRRLSSDGEGLAPVTADVMTTIGDPAQVSLAELAHRCSRETQEFFQRRDYDPRYCLELFRRAMVARDQGAWELVYAQYRPLVTRWVFRHPSFRLTGEEAQFFVNRAFEKMWTALDPGKFGGFGSLPAVLRYLQMCVHSAIMDLIRDSDPAEEIDEDAAENIRSADPPVEERIVRRERRRELWARLETRLKSEQERCVLRGCFALALKPVEVYERYRDHFSSIQEVYRVKENLIDRLRRDPELAEYLGDL